jgi:hypothetical protein
VRVLIIGRIAAVFGFAVLLPVVASAQATISGTVRDASGAVLPGVTVEAASPALIEKVRTAVTDGTGQFAIENLRPGQYAVTFTLPGFAVVRREGVELQGTFNARINAELRVGAVEETITVTGATPLVDVQSTTRQEVIDRNVLDTLPSSGSRTALGVLIAGVDFRRQEVGGAGTAAPTGNMTAHGSYSEDAATTLNGISIASFGVGAATSVLSMNPMGVQEIQIDTGSNNAELHAGGVRTNFVLKEGGNAFHGVVFGAYAPGELQSDNLSDDLRARGLSTPTSIRANWDINPGFGGPLLQDRIWFYFAARYNMNSEYVAGLFENKNLNNPSVWTYEPDLTRRVANEQRQPDAQLRMTWQATPRSKIGFTTYNTTYCFCPSSASTTTAREASAYADYPEQRLVAGDWTMPATSRLLFEMKGQYYGAQSNRSPATGLDASMINVQEQATGMSYRAGNQYRYQFQDMGNIAGSTSYVTGAHAFKIGFNWKLGTLHFVDYDLQPLSYRFRNGVPNRITQRALGEWKATVDADLGAYVQDRWTVRDLTVNYGLRWDYFTFHYPEQHIGPAVLAPNRNITFPRMDGWSLHDLSPRLGAVYNLGGSGKTALKGSLNRYLLAMGPDVGFVQRSNPSRNLVTSATRSWNDSNRDYVPNCDLTNPRSNGECGALSNLNFGTTVANMNFDEEMLTGFGKRTYNWEISAGVQRELLPTVSADATYFRRWYGNHVVVDDLAVGPADFDAYSITAPRDPRLPGGGGYVIDGFYDIKPEKFGVAANPLVTLDRRYGRIKDVWDGVTASVNARPNADIFLRAGVSTGRRVEDICEIVAKTAKGESPNYRYAWDSPSQVFCSREEPLQTQFKGYGAYTIPEPFDVQISATYQSKPGPLILAQYAATNAEVRRSLGRDLSGGAQNVELHLLSPGQFSRGDAGLGAGERLGRIHQVDVRIAKLLDLRGTRLRASVDLYNALNSAAVLAHNFTFGDNWLTPTEIILGRFLKFSAQLDF